MNEKAKSAVEGVMAAWRKVCPRLSSADYIEAAEEIADRLTAHADAAKEEAEAEDDTEGE